MDSFQITVMTIATVILILIFSVVGIILTTSETDKVYPPVANTCPDYWSVSTEDPNVCIVPSTSNVNIGKVYDKSSEGNVILNLSGNKEDGKITTPGFSKSDLTGVNSINFASTEWGADGMNPICAKKAWTGRANVVWDGVSNYNSC